MPHPTEGRVFFSYGQTPLRPWPSELCCERAVNVDRQSSAFGGWGQDNPFDHGADCFLASIHPVGVAKAKNQRHH